MIWFTLSELKHIHQGGRLMVVGGGVQTKPSFLCCVFIALLQHTAPTSRQGLVTKCLVLFSARFCGNLGQERDGGAGKQEAGSGGLARTTSFCRPQCLGGQSVYQPAYRKLMTMCVCVRAWSRVGEQSPRLRYV